MGRKELYGNSCAVSVEKGSSVFFGNTCAQETSTISISVPKYLTILLFKVLNWNALTCLNVSSN